VHVLGDLQAVVHAREPVSELPRDALFVTSLRPTAPLALINVSMGDRAALEERSCGCPLAELGWRTHLHGIRSFEKLTGGGVTFLDSDVIRVLEDVLPGRFGGDPPTTSWWRARGQDGCPRDAARRSPARGIAEDEIAEFIRELTGRLAASA
jgi:hypothetical protein